MHNIWELFLQTCTLSLVAMLLLIVKVLLRDKLSPRWQYAVWGILALRALIPVGVERYILLPLPHWIETVKGIAESRLTSAYTDLYLPIAPEQILPVVKTAPRSLTDWLLLLYIVGVIAALLWYLIGYIRLRLLIRKGTPVSVDTQTLIESIAIEHKLKPFRPIEAVELEGLPSAFICGVIRPVLVIPAGGIPDKKILLHELLHLRHQDALQNIFWSILRALHWYNPFLQYVFDRIGNDMESVCDQRVLERLDGEERRAYGLILLSMANERYARAPGTSSLSNGGKNIARRIEAIVRFRKYPRGMALVSVCIAISLVFPSMFGSVAAYELTDYQPESSTELHAAMALARINRCTTRAGALDTYAKGLLNGNGVMLATASPNALHHELEETMRTHNKDRAEKWAIPQNDELAYVISSEGYTVYNIDGNEKSGYQALLLFPLSGEIEIEDQYGQICRMPTFAVPVRVYKEGDIWLVEETGGRELVGGEYDQIWAADSNLPRMRVLTAETEYGTISVTNLTLYSVSNRVETSESTSFFGSVSYTDFDQNPKTNADFDQARIWSHTTYDMNTKTVDEAPQEFIAVLTAEMDSLDQKVTFPDSVTLTGDVSGGSNQGFDWLSKTVTEDWDGIAITGGGHGYGGVGTDIIPFPEAYTVQIYWDEKLMVEVVLSEEGSFFPEEPSPIEPPSKKWKEAAGYVP